MTTQQWMLSLVLATMVFSVALELQVSDFRRVAQTPKAVVCGLIPQFILLPVGTWLATLALGHPRALFGLGDAGAHVGTVCDASFSTFMLTHWVQGRAQDRLPLEQAVEMMTSRNARYLGLNDRGLLAPGLRADINVIDPTRRSVGAPKLVRDLPAGGKRFLQKAEGYLGTWVAGQCVARAGEVTAARPGRLVRSGQQTA